MGSRNTLVALFFIAATVVAVFVFDKAAAGIMASANMANTSVLGDRFTVSTAIALVLAVAGGAFAWMNMRSRDFVGESVDELGKVSWPEWSETKVNTVVVIVFSFLAAGVLGVFDSTFAKLTNFLLETL